MLQANASLARRIGLATYPLYLLHDVVGAAVMKQVFLITDNRWVALGGSMVFVCLISWVVANHAERLLREKLATWLCFPRRQSHES
jgi:peptidoglycan/LPS O-acetylase OafA/YrhL